VGDSLTGGMAGDYTSWGQAIKVNLPYSAVPQAEVEQYRGWLRE
jgi:hypothetical protein